MQQTFRQKLIAGERLIGTLVTLATPEVAELMASVGYDWLFIDCEHGAFDVERAQGLIQAAKPCPCVVRVPCAEEIWIKKALDIGAAGIIVPQVRNAMVAERLVSYSKYPPAGKRGVGIGRAHGYGLKFKETLENANAEVAVILQAESREAIEDIQAIASVSGVDAVLVGPYDLSASLGKMGLVNDPVVIDAINTVRSACMNKDVKLGIFGVNASAVRPWVERDFSLVAVGVDTLCLIKSAQENLSETRAMIA